MAQWRLKLDQSSDGTGTVVNPANVPASITPGDNDTIWIDGNTSTRLAIPASWYLANNLTIGKWGNGEAAIFDGSVIRTDWADLGGGIYSRSYATEGNVVGNVCEDGAFMKMVRWTSGVPALQPGQFSFKYTSDNGGQVLYIRPSAGVPSQHVYTVSERDYGWYSFQTKTGLYIPDGAFQFRQHSVHSFGMLNRRLGRVKGVKAVGAGGKYSAAAGTWLGNGFELADGTFDWELELCEATDIYDSPFTSQTYGVRGRLADHLYKNIIGRRYGLTGVEIATIIADTRVEGILVDGFEAYNANRGCWAETGTTAGGRGVVYATYNHAGPTARISGCRGRRIKWETVQRGWVTGETGGTNYFENAHGDVPQVYLCSSNLILPRAIGQNDIWFDVSDSAGNTPNNPGAGASANSQYVQLQAAHDWATTRVL